MVTLALAIGIALLFLATGAGNGGSIST